MTMRARRELVANLHAPMRAAHVSLEPLRVLTSLRSLSLRQPMYSVDAEVLAAMTGLTHLSLRLQRRDRLGLGTALQCAPAPPGP